MPETEPSDADRFLGEAERRGQLNAAQSADCRRIAGALSEVQADLPVDEIAMRKGWLSAPQVAEIRRALARMRVGRYEVIGRIGEGAAGVVWKARDTKLDRVVALKVLSQKAEAAPAFKERFLREARIAVTLNHVNIVRGLDYGEADGYHYFAMEFVEGENAEQHLARLGRVPEKEAVSMALQVVRALEHAQKFHIVHRDIKPGNLLITAAGQVKLGDLGLAKPMLAEAELLVGDGSTAGTPFYMSPEQIRAPEKVEWRSDVYSLGATLYHLMTSQPPFRSDGKGSVIQKHLHERPRNPRESVLELSDGVSAIVLRMLQKDPADRYASLEDLATDLEAVHAGRPPLHTSTTPLDAATTERHARHAVARRITEQQLPKERFPWAAVVAFVVFAAILTGGWYAMHPKPADTAHDANGGSRGGAPAVNLVPDPPVVISAPAPRDPVPSSLDIESRAQSELTLAIDRAKTEGGDQHWSAAIEELNAFIRKFPETKAGAKAQEEIGTFERNAGAQFGEILRAAKTMGEEHRFDAAQSQIEKAERFEMPWAMARARDAKRALDADRERYEKNRETQAPAFADLYGTVLLAAGKEGVAAARPLATAGAAALDACTEELAVLHADLTMLEKSKRDSSLLDRRTPHGALAIVLTHISRGQVADAEVELSALSKAGGDAEEARARIARVRGVLQRRADEIDGRAAEALSASRLDDAYRLADEAHRLLPDYAPPRVYLGRIRFAQNDVKGALDWLTKAAERRDAPAEAHLRLGQVLARGDDLARSESELRQFLAQTDANDPLRADAEKELREVSARFVESSVTRWKKTAKDAMKKGKGKIAEGAWGRVVEIAPDDGEALVQLGQVYVDAGKADPARFVLIRAAKLPAADPFKKKADQMLASLKKSGTLADGPGLAEKGNRWFANKAWGDAIQQYRGALAVAPYLCGTRSKLVQALLARLREDPKAGAEADDANAAVEESEALVALFPDDAAALTLSSQAYLAAGQPAKALEAAKAAASLDMKSAPALLAEGRAHMALGKFRLALTSFDKSRKLEPTPAALLGLASAYAGDEDLESAQQMLDELERRFGEVPRELKGELNELMERLSGDK